MTDRDGSDGGVRPQRPAPAGRDGGPGVRTVYLHIGTMKTGTTYLQSRLKEHHADLTRDGVVVPLGQVGAVRDRFGRPGTLTRREVDGAWSRLVTRLATATGDRGVLSMEFLSTASPQVAREIVAEFAPADVQVIVTLRDMPRVLGAQWQETIQNRAVWSWAEYSQAVLAELVKGVSPSTAGPSAATDATDTPEPADSMGDDDEESSSHPAQRPQSGRRSDRAAGASFWRQHDVARILGDWTAVVGADHLHVVTVPGPGSPPDLLWERFMSVVGVDAHQYQRTAEPIKANISLDLGAAEFLRRLNARLDPEISRTAYVRYIKQVLAKRALVERGSTGSKPQLTAEQHARVLMHTDRLIAHITSLGVAVVGDLRELVPAPLSAATAIDEATLGRDITDTAIDAVSALIRHMEGVDTPATEATPDAPAPDSDVEGGDRGDRSQRREQRRARRADRGAARSGPSRFLGGGLGGGGGRSAVDRDDNR